MADWNNPTPLWMRDNPMELFSQGLQAAQTLAQTQQAAQLFPLKLKALDLEIQKDQAQAVQTALKMQRESQDWENYTNNDIPAIHEALANVKSPNEFATAPLPWEKVKSAKGWQALETLSQRQLMTQRNEALSNEAKANLAEETRQRNWLASVTNNPLFSDLVSSKLDWPVGTLPSEDVRTALGLVRQAVSDRVYQLTANPPPGMTLSGWDTHGLPKFTKIAEATIKGEPEIIDLPTGERAFRTGPNTFKLLGTEKPVSVTTIISALRTRASILEKQISDYSIPAQERANIRVKLNGIEKQLEEINVAPESNKEKGSLKLSTGFRYDIAPVSK